MLTTEFLTIASAICPDRTAIIFENKRLSYMELAERTNRLANALRGLGVKKGDKVAIMQVNTNEVIESYFAIAKLDAIYIPLSFRAKAEELTYMLNNSDADALLVGSRYVPMIDSIKKDLPHVKYFIALEQPAKWMKEYERLLASASSDDVFPESQDDDMTILMYTAGTTGAPKGVMLSHNSFSTYVLNNVSPPDPEVDEKNILTVPLYHIAGIQAVLAAVYGGRTLVLQRQFEADDWMRLVEKEKVNRAMMVPTMLKQLMEHPDFTKRDLSSLKVITYGAAPMPLEVIKKAIELMPNTRFINAFGQTESASTITMLSPEDHVIDPSLPAAEKEKRFKRLASIGKPLSDVEIRIVDEDGKDVPSGVAGEIAARGPRVMKGYWKQEAATSQTIRGGWLFTGDLGYVDEEGYIFLSGRAKDVIKRGGELIACEEIEQVLLSHPSVDDAAVIGVPDDTWGEIIRALIVPKPGAKVAPEELTEYSRQKLSSYKKPESIIFVNELPRNPMGKVLKRVLRDQVGKPGIPNGSKVTLTPAS